MSPRPNARPVVPLRAPLRRGRAVVAAPAAALALLALARPEAPGLLDLAFWAAALAALARAGWPAGGPEAGAAALAAALSLPPPWGAGLAGLAALARGGRGAGRRAGVEAAAALAAAWAAQLAGGPPAGVAGAAAWALARGLLAPRPAPWAALLGAGALGLFLARLYATPLWGEWGGWGVLAAGLLLGWHRYRLLESAAGSVAEAAARALEGRDPQTRRHSERVAAIAADVGRELGLAPEELRRLERGARLHDLGKVAVPDRLLHKRGALGLEEWRAVAEHVRAGERILEPAAVLLGEAFEVVRAHHERWDGRGYPRGLAGEEIPLLARVVAVADAYEAMTADRAYRPACTPEEARARVLAGSGSQFDPRVVAAFDRAWSRAPAWRVREAAPDPAAGGGGGVFIFSPAGGRGAAKLMEGLAMRRSGVTLVEMLVALAVAGALAGVVVAALTSTARRARVEAAAIVSKEQAQAVLQGLAKELAGKTAALVLPGAGGDRVTVVAAEGVGYTVLRAGYSPSGLRLLAADARPLAARGALLVNGAGQALFLPALSGVSDLGGGVWAVDFGGCVNPVRWTENTRLYPASTVSLRAEGGEVLLSLDGAGESRVARLPGFGLRYLYSAPGREAARADYPGPSFVQDGQTFTLFALGLYAEGASEGVSRAFTERLPLRRGSVAVREVVPCGGSAPAAGRGTVVLDIQNAPFGDVDLAAGGWSRGGVSRDSTFTDVPVGDLTVVAREVWDGDTLWRWQDVGAPQASRGYRLEAYAVTRVVVDYLMAKGALAITVSGLPAGVSVEADLAGPETRRLTLGNGVTRLELTPGAYTLTLPELRAGAAVVWPDPPTAQPRLRSLQTTDLSVRYAVVPGQARLEVNRQGDDAGTDPQAMVCLKLNGEQGDCPF